MNRREFLKLSAAGGILLATDGVLGRPAAAKGMPSGAVGILYDATLCIGCKLCMGACKEANSVPGGALWSEGMTAPPYEFRPGLPTSDAPADLSGRTLNIIKKAGTGATRDVPGGWSFVKRHCMHCLEPACVSACPVSAMKKDGSSGIVTYNKDACIGCRYCQVACPFNIPRFEWDVSYPQIRKCQLCVHRIPEGKYSACCEACPTGASIYGQVAELQAEGRRRLALAPGAELTVPLQRVDGTKSLTLRAATYLKHLYGEKEVGGAQYLLLAGLPFESLGLPPLPEKSYVSRSEGIQHTLYKGMIGPGVLLAGLLAAAYKSTRDHQ